MRSKREALSGLSWNLGTLLTKQARFRLSWNALGCLAECSRPPKIATLGSLKIINFGVPERPGGVKLDPQRRLGPISGPLLLLKASCGDLGGLLDRSWWPPGPNKNALERLLAGPRGFQDRFQPSLVPPKEAKMMSNRAREATGAQNGETLNFEGRLIKFINF